MAWTGPISEEINLALTVHGERSSFAIPSDSAMIYVSVYAGGRHTPIRSSRPTIHGDSIHVVSIHKDVANGALVREHLRSSYLLGCTLLRHLTLVQARPNNTLQQSELCCVVGHSRLQVVYSGLCLCSENGRVFGFHSVHRLRANEGLASYGSCFWSLPWCCAYVTGFGLLDFTL